MVVTKMVIAKAPMRAHNYARPTTSGYSCSSTFATGGASVLYLVHMDDMRHTQYGNAT